MCKILCFKKQQKQAEAEIGPSSSLVEIEVKVEVGAGVDVEFANFRCCLYFHGLVGGWMSGGKIGG